MNKLDKLAFETINLENGHILHVQEIDLPLTYIRISIPVGNGHAHAGNPGIDGGYLHFLEHMCFESSVHYPDKKNYTDLLSKTGSSQNAWTDAFYTVYNFEAPATTFAAAFPAFLEHLISPNFSCTDIELQQSIITNERNQRKYFPDWDLLSQYERINWLDSTYYSKEQIFGSDKNLASITSDKLAALHQNYFNLPIDIYVAGTFDKVNLIDELKKIPESKNKNLLSVQINTPNWNNQKFHIFPCRDIDTNTYHIGGMYPGFSVEEVWGVEFILQMLIHEEFGTLQNWIRKDNGWSYGLEPELEYERDRIIWSIKMPLDSVTVVEQIRTELPGRIITTIENSALIESTRNRLLLQMCFDYETITSRLDRVVFIRNIAGYVPTEKDYHVWLTEIINPKYINDLYKKHFAPEKTGEFLAVPDKN